MKLLITGGAGFMGSNFVHYILKKYPDYQIVNLDKLTYAGNLDNLRDIEKNPNYTFIKGDITDEALVDKLFQDHKFDTVINYAAETHVDRSITGPRDFVITDVVGTCTLLEATKKHNVKKYVQISTDEVYGSINNGSFNEISPFMPNSPYSASKAGADHLCRAYFVTYNLPVIVTHSCNVFGPYQYPEKVIPLFITNLMRGLKVPLYGDGKNVREWIYVEDHCIAIDEILHKGRIGEVYNIGTGNEIQNIDLTKMVFEKMGANEDQIEYVKDRLGHDRRYSVDFSKLKNELGWTPKFSFSEALSETINWYKKNESWWKKLI
ncbi:MAG: dTDP-glucose 4,6-dehydratase, dTDP-glucose 4,6-dehydratase [Candidatus Peregrinibacteria bacterium GW2011_GWF2_38_29]|nr:MAG: dTDP-glucose 4,6-dehydratase, dTDP-glucose 4,6-dehydratase [Candidatus Peregrinibacteria bacterium GW2011_GWF2_38_29]HBB03201.1 dTDP-glucose 4,6-dehydratase [Candidatus Peregrinibacteria bacterium]